MLFFLDEYYSSRDKSHFKCLICNYTWKALPKGVISGNNGCPECGRKIAKQTIKYNIDTNIFKNKIKKIFGDKISIIGEYINFYNDIKVECNICGYIWISKPTYLMKKSGCHRCGHIETGKKTRKTHIIFLDEIYEIYKNKITVLGIYNTGNDRIDVKCNICNHMWSPVSRGLLRRGCPKCNFSKGELLIENILIELNLKFKSQYVIDGLKTEKKGVPIFDFVIFDELNNIKNVIEYDGLQHFKAIKKWGGEIKLQRQKEVDEFKNKYCKDNNIKMIRIPYTELKNINKIYIENKI